MSIFQRRDFPIGAAAFAAGATATLVGTRQIIGRELPIAQALDGAAGVHAV
jgi:hypothetical protein